MYSPTVNITGMLKSTDYDINHIEPGNQVTIYCIWNKVYPLPSHFHIIYRSKTVVYRGIYFVLILYLKARVGNRERSIYVLHRHFANPKRILWQPRTFLFIKLVVRDCR